MRNRTSLGRRFLGISDRIFTFVLWMSDIDGDAAKLRPANFHTGSSHGFNKMSCIDVEGTWTCLSRVDVYDKSMILSKSHMNK